MNNQILKIIEEVKSVRVGNNRAWIYNEDGTLKEDIFLIDILPLLERMAENEEEITDIPDSYFTKCDEIVNTYNYNANITNDILFIRNGNYVSFSIHLCGDARANYSDKAIIKIPDYYDSFFQYLLDEYEEEVCIFKRIDNEYDGNISIFSDGIEVYNIEGIYVTTLYEYERQELIENLEYRRD